MAERKEPEASPPSAPESVDEAAAKETAAPPAATAEPEDWETRFRYLLADFENFRKRVAKERDSLRQSVRAEVLLSLLPTYEATVRARESVARLPANDPVRHGIELLSRQWSTFLEREHVTPVARRGEPFRSEWHEAVAEAPAGDGIPPGSVLEIVQQGYRIDSGLLRPAKVVVARSPSAAAAGEATGEAATEPDASDSG